jgi:D-glycero-D-manno-heptose 1,7-bisphosphate phosphatase
MNVPDVPAAQSGRVKVRRKAVFLDRDGVLVVDRGLVTRPEEFDIMKGVPEALHVLKNAGYLLIVVTNQAVVARGLISERDLEELHRALQEMLSKRGAPPLDAVYSCPHHPSADLPGLRMVCECRKPRPGMLLKAAEEHSVELNLSHMIGDRFTDILAGRRAGCRTTLLETGAHLAPPIESGEVLSGEIRPDYLEVDLLAAARRITGYR